MSKEQSEKRVVKALPKENGEESLLFKNPFLEKITKTHILVPIGILAFGSNLLLYKALGRLDLTKIVLAFIVGLFTFSLVEYLLHRYVFHMLPTSAVKKKLQYAFHGVHHDYPKDKYRLAMPPWLSAMYSVIFFFLMYLFLGQTAYAFVPGFLIGYCLYLGIHYIVHVYVPPKNFLRSLWINHAIHHYKDDEVAFGVSSPLWDYVFGTMPKRKK